MATSGPRPKPVEQKQREGEKPGRMPNPPLRTGGIPELDAPEHLNSWQQKAWKEIVTVLKDLDVLDKADMFMVEQAAVMLGRMREARKELLTADMIEYTQRGAAVPSPWWRIEREASMQATKLLTELGLSPTARARLANGGTKSKKPEERLDSVLGEPGRLRVVKDARA